MIDHLKSMAIFATVADMGSFRSAAKRLELSPSVVSNHISTLESQIGAALLFRSTRTLSLTLHGEQLYKSAALMLQTARDGLYLFSDDAPEILSELRVAIPSALSSHPIFKKITYFARERSGIRLHIVSSDRPHDLLKEGIDIAVRMGTFPDSDFKTRRIGEERRILIAAPDYLATQSEIMSPSDLQFLHFISFSLVPDRVNLSQPNAQSQQFWGKTIATTDSCETMRSMALAGLGLAVIPYHAVEADIAQNYLVQILPDWSEQILPIHLTWPRNSDLSTTTRSFIDYLSG